MAGKHLLILEQLQHSVLQKIESGEYKPFVYPYDAFGFYLLFTYLLLPPTKSNLVYGLRYPVFAVICGHAVTCILRSRSPLVALAYLVGLTHGLMMLQALHLIILNDARSDYRRIERSRSTKDDDKNALDRRGLAHEKPAYQWQGLPNFLSARIGWVLDVVTTFRAPGWAHHISGLPSPPARIRRGLELAGDGQAEAAPGQPSQLSELTRQQLWRHNLPRLLLEGLLLDLFKTVTMTDPYFYTFGPSSPSPFLFPAVTRIFISAIYTYLALSAIMRLSPLVFACLLGPRVLGDYASPWLYPPAFGSFTAIGSHGLLGAWGRWWHQLFRTAFEQVGDIATWGFLGDKKATKTPAAKFLRMIAAFGCSAMLHVIGSYTTLGETRPFRGSAAFFIVQPVGVLLQTEGARALQNHIPVLKNLPWWMLRASSYVYVALWFTLTGPLIADDFAAGGVWLWEPVPISLFRGLQGKGWWCWKGAWWHWHSGQRWWQSGIAF